MYLIQCELAEVSTRAALQGWHLWALEPAVLLSTSLSRWAVRLSPLGLAASADSQQGQLLPCLSSAGGGGAALSSAEDSCGFHHGDCPIPLTSSMSPRPLYLKSVPGSVTSHCCSSESTSPEASTDGARTEDTDAIALETKERLFIDVSRGQIKLGGGADTFMVLSDSQEFPREQVQHTQPGVPPVHPAHIQVLGAGSIYTPPPPPRIVKAMLPL